MTKLLLIRHGQSLWNAENRFTGWVDSPLSNKGVQEAKKAGQLIKDININIEICYTSFLSRAINTLEILLREINKNELNIIKSWELNERHYGSLTGLNKLETKMKIGDELFLRYRRSWETAPPEIEKNNKNLQYFSILNRDIPKINIPKTESLEDTYNRVIKFYNNNLVKLMSEGKTLIISAHGNSLRALCKYLFNISNSAINALEIPTGNPMVIELTKSLRIKKAFYLDIKRALPIPVIK